MMKIGMELDPFTYYPAVCRSECKIVGVGLDSYGYNQVLLDLVSQNSEKNVRKSYKDAVQRVDAAKWIKQLELELYSFNFMNIWELVKFPGNRKAIRTKWSFDVKKDGKGWQRKNIIV